MHTQTDWATSQQIKGGGGGGDGETLESLPILFRYDVCWWWCARVLVVCLEKAGDSATYIYTYTTQDAHTPHKAHIHDTLHSPHIHDTYMFPENIASTL